MAGDDQGQAGKFVLEVDGDIFRKAVRLFESWIPQNQLKARSALWLDRQELVVRIGNDEFRVPATGAWSGTVVTAAGFLIAETALLPDSEKIQLSVDADRLQLRTPRFSKTIVCEIVENGHEWPEFIEQLTPFTLVEFLLLPHLFSQASIEYSGLADEVVRSVDYLEDLLDFLTDAIYEATSDSEFDAAQAKEALGFLLGPGVEELQRRRA